MAGENPKAIVSSGYDLASLAYRADQDPAADAQYRSWLTPLLQQIRPGAAVLDLGCGCGIPAARILADQFLVTGVDISGVQIERARSLVPNATFLHADITSLSFAPGSFAALVALYSLIHVPLEQQPALISSLYSWLSARGLAVLIVGSHAWTGTEHDWLGVPGATMYWSHADCSTYRGWFTDCGFSILEEAFIPEAQAGHQRFLLAKGPHDR